ncbi:phosphorylase family protein [Nonomuraea endophytica]|uniref:5'-methylthioadenosine/S-adenosylhomocysteine nucleosidase family protein n=1 Tax=Nonomuraea endophytica TaxID=714136 RepID=UPI0037C76CB6
MSADHADPGRAYAPAVTFAQARAAARAARTAEHGRQVRRTARPRGVFGAIRSRTPLSLQLYGAALEGRLVWRGETEFAVLEPPLGRRPPSGTRGAWLRRADRRWDMLVAFTPPAVMLVLSLAFIPPALAQRGLLVVVIALPVLAACHVAVVMLAMMVNLLWQAVRPVVERGRDHRVSTDELRDEHWSVALCHQARPERAEPLIRQIVGRLAALPEEWGDDRGSLVCVLSGVTTEAMRTAFLTRARHSRLDEQGDGLAFLVSLPRPRPWEPSERDAVSGFLLYVFAGATVVFGEAVLVADFEAEACGNDCAGRPATYWTAVRWLSQRLLLTDPPGLSPQTPQAIVVGWLTSLMAITGVMVAVTAGRWYLAAGRRRRVRLDRELIAMDATTKVLLLVATGVEHEQVKAVVRARTEHAPEVEFRGHHAVFHLGVVSKAAILLARSEAGTTATAGAMLTAQTLIPDLRPDYVILTGICYGLRKGQQRIGDVLVSNQIRVLDLKKIVDGASGPVEIPRGARAEPSVRLLNGCYAVDTVKSHIGVMLSGNTLLNSEEERARLIAAHPDALGGDMEGAGVYAAAAKHRTEWIVIKAISDWGVGKTHRHQPKAARNAAEFVLRLIDLGALDTPAQPDSSR